MKDNVRQEHRMWRTLVRVDEINKEGRTEGVYLIIPGWNVRKSVWCPIKAIPPAIWEGMRKGKRYHVGCNIGAKYDSQLCFDGWENE
jgi:hypothetical protein